MAEESDFQKRVRESLEKGDPIPDFPTDLDMSNAALNELYLGHVKSGFNSAQALYLVASMLTGNPGVAPRSVEDED